MRIIYLAIIPLLFIGLLSIILGSDLVSIEIRYLKYDAVDKDFDAKHLTFEIDDLTYGMSIFVAIITATALIGIQILGSGLQDTSVRVITLIILYMGLWTLLSILGWNLLFANQIVGSIVYVFLCLFYIIGVSSKIAGVGD